MKIKKFFLSILVAALCLGMTAPAVWSATPFGVDVTDAIDDGLDYLRNQSAFTSTSGTIRQARGLCLLALLEKYRATGVDEIMIGRGALSRPQIFREIKEEREMPLSREEASGIIMRLYRERTECHGERRGVVEMRKMVPFLVKGWRDAKQVRMAANRADSMAQVREIFI